MLYYYIRNIALVIINVMQYALLFRAIMSWIPQLQGSGLSAILYQVTEPVVYPFRKLLSRIRGLEGIPVDLSTLLAFLALSLLRSLL